MEELHCIEAGCQGVIQVPDPWKAGVVTCPQCSTRYELGFEDDKNPETGEELGEWILQRVPQDSSR